MAFAFWCCPKAPTLEMKVFWSQQTKLDMSVSSGPTDSLMATAAPSTPMNERPNENIFCSDVTSFFELEYLTLNFLLTLCTSKP